MTCSEKMGSFYSGITCQDIPPHVMKKARLTLFDFLCVLRLGAKYTVINPIIKRYLVSLEHPEKYTVLGLKMKSSLEHAVLGMSVVSHGVELDDGHLSSATHPAVAVIPAALAMAEKCHSNLRDLLVSIVVGYDCMIRFAKAINPKHLSLGFHSTSTCGTLGAACAAGWLLGLDSEQLSHALGIAALQSAGLQEMLHENASIKPFQVGKSSSAGIIAAELAALGSKSPSKVFEGQYGWFNAMSNNDYRETDLWDRLGKHWMIMDTYVKLYPSCRYAHAAIDSALELYDEGYRMSNVKNVKLYLFQQGINEVGVFKVPSQYEDALFSVAYSIAIAFQYGKVRIEEIASNLQNTRILEFADNIDIISDKQMTDSFPREAGSRIIFEDDNGNIVVRENKRARADFDTPLTDEEYLLKAAQILENVVHRKYIDVLWEKVVLSDQKMDVKEIIELMNEMGA
ncbi:MAG TPA: MmgE/PrpD family protein [Clostridiaceae bacterium]|nr:MmgE/PrpD family protein [Clostridiaceae bacterium]